MVRVVRLERTVSWSQTRRDTNFAIPGYSLSCHDTTANGKNKVFSVCGHLCGQSRFYAVFGNRGKSRKCRWHKTLRRFASPYPGYRHGTPKADALPTALYPVVKFLPIQTAYVSGLTFILTYILYINTAESAIFFSARLPHCAAISLSGTALLHISATRYIFNSLNTAKIAVAWYSCM